MLTHGGTLSLLLLPWRQSAATMPPNGLEPAAPIPQSASIRWGRDWPVGSERCPCANDYTLRESLCSCDRALRVSPTWQLGHHSISSTVYMGPAARLSPLATASLSPLATAS